MNWQEKFALHVYAVVIQGDKILATLHDRGLGAFWGLPGEWVQPGDPIGTAAELAVLEQTSMNVSPGRLLAVEHVTVGHLSDDELFVSLECTLKSKGVPKVPQDGDPSDASITHAAWVELDEFMYGFPLPEVERNFWNRSIRVFRGEETPNLHEIELK